MTNQNYGYFLCVRITLRKCLEEWIEASSTTKINTRHTSVVIFMLQTFHSGRKNLCYALDRTEVHPCDSFNVAVNRKTVCLPEIKFRSFIPQSVILMTEISWPIIKCLPLLLLRLFFLLLFFFFFASSSSSSSPSSSSSSSSSSSYPTE